MKVLRGINKHKCFYTFSEHDVDAPNQKLLFTRFYMEKLKTTWIEKVNKYISGEKKFYT